MDKVIKGASKSVDHLKFDVEIVAAQLQVSKESVSLFLELCGELQERTNIIFPQKIVMLNGAPGAGKGTNTRSVMKCLNISTDPVIVSSLLRYDPKLVARIDAGFLIGDREVVAAVLKKLVELGSKGESSVILDGYPRTQKQAECISLVRWYSEHILSRPIEEISVVFLVNEEVSVQRQLSRGRNALKYNQKNEVDGDGPGIEVRKTDLDENSAYLRYSQFIEKTLPAIDFLRKYVKSFDIDATGSFEDVTQHIIEALQKEEK